jgi:hypothetical protein
MRQLTDHKVNGLNEALTINVLDEPGAGGACHEYEITWEGVEGTNVVQERVTVKFQNGPVKEKGVNGVSIEALLGIVVDRLRAFQDGPFACIENGRALQHVGHAMEWLHKRTIGRAQRGVEGTN